MADLRVAPIGLKQANEYVERVHRHHGPTRGMRFAVAVVDRSGDLRGVGIAGRPVSRVLQAEGYIEVTRVATDGTKNACSMIYGSLRRAAMALGYPADRIVSYILESESGASLRASGWVPDGEAGGGTWSRSARERTDRAPITRKVRYLAGPRSHDSGATSSLSPLAVALERAQNGAADDRPEEQQAQDGAGNAEHDVEHQRGRGVEVVHGVDSGITEIPEATP